MPTPIKLPPLPEADRRGPYSAEQMIEYALAMRKGIYDKLAMRPSSQIITKWLKDNPDGGTLTDIYKDCNLSAGVVHQFLALRHGVHVDRWVRGKAPGGHSAVYCLGNYPDAPRPERPVSKGEKS
jgi:hypothetical protein